MHTRLFFIAAPATRTRGASGAEAALVTLGDGSGAYLAWNSSPAAWHTAQALASACKVAVGTVRDGTSGGRGRGPYLRWRVAVHYDVGVTALLEVWIKDRLTGRAPAQVRHLGESAILH
jgi:hypothetical protein